MTDTDRSKYLMALLVIAAASGLLWLGRLDGAQWVSAVTWTVAAYMLGQVGAVVATGWTAQVVARTKAVASSWRHEHDAMSMTPILRQTTLKSSNANGLWCRLGAPRHHGTERNLTQHSALKRSHHNELRASFAE